MSEKEKPNLILSFEDASDVYGLIVDAETTFEQRIYDYENKEDPTITREIYKDSLEMLRVCQRLDKIFEPYLEKVDSPLED